jgi:hypothetical protein
VIINGSGYFAGAVSGGLQSEWYAFRREDRPAAMRYAHNYGGDNLDLGQ